MAAQTAQTLVMDAVEQLGLRVTLGDIASSTGLALHDAKQELLNLAQKAEGHLQVSDQGEIAYVFPRGFRSILSRKEQQDRAAALRRKLWGGFLYGLRVSFGIMLVVSIVLIILALIALQMAASRGEGNNNRNRSRGGLGFYYFPNLWIGNPFWRPYPYYGYRGYSGQARPSQQPQEKSELNFLEAVYSFLFGDGDPNADLEEKRYALIGQVIRANGGVIAAEQVLPYLDVEPGSAALEYEDYMLPILVKFDGQPEVSDEGDIVYRFPELQVVAADRQSNQIPGVLSEQRWVFSRATSGQLTLAGGLGVLNFFLAAILYGARGEVAAAAGSNTFLAFIYPLIGFLFLYGTLFLAVPTIRWFTLQVRNQQVERRNRIRQLWQEKWKNPTEALQRKLDFARHFSRQEVVRESDTIYSTDRDLIEQRDYRLDQPEFRQLLESQALEEHPETKQVRKRRL
ncbi:hypothetical protein L1047_01830 [Synechococcus sp. Nb3U1]|uniref:hypothetical protein n=1 Tax=Synechococcus sp. Nb3U1 TaxID=1914529 RepID=UPI001F2663C4|nr:hypothetical protein [Synechococcus sp. Nb3U1]MCF2969935.1 hypothetical protein [Synechococcus sp. Nb3U1]